METNKISDVVHELNSLELAVLVCLVADQHCIVRASEHRIPDILAELQLICSSTFELTCAVLSCSEATTLADFSDAVVLKYVDTASNDEVQEYGYHTKWASKASSETYRPKATKSPSNVLDNRKVAHVVIATNLERTSRDVQIQALELMRSRRIFSRTAVHATPKRFLFIALQSTSASGPPLYTPFLNDYFFISHTILPDQHLTSLSAARRVSSSSSQSSEEFKADRQTTFSSSAVKVPRITERCLADIQMLTQDVQITAEMRRHIHNIVTFLRLSRHVANGVSAVATRHFNLLCRILAPLHNLGYVTPNLVALAARKIYPHRIEVVTDPGHERSTQWGSNAEAVRRAMMSVTGESLLEDILEEVECPL